MVKAEPIPEDALARRGRHEPPPVFEARRVIPQCTSVIQYADRDYRRCPYSAMVEGDPHCWRCRGGA